MVKCFIFYVWNITKYLHQYSLEFRYEWNNNTDIVLLLMNTKLLMTNRVIYVKLISEI